MPSMGKIKPFNLPYTKGGIGQQISGVGQRISSSATNLWSGLRSSITNGLIYRSLGYGELSAKASSTKTNPPMAPSNNNNDNTTEDVEMSDAGDTLFSKFRVPEEGGAAAAAASSASTSSKSAAELEQQAAILRKLKSLNRTGRIDFTLQESLFENAIVSAVASHLSYWAEQDLAHFMLTQLYFTALQNEKARNLEQPGKG